MALGREREKGCAETTEVGAGPRPQRMKALVKKGHDRAGPGGENTLEGKERS